MRVVICAQWFSNGHWSHFSFLPKNLFVGRDVSYTCLAYTAFKFTEILGLSGLGGSMGTEVYVGNLNWVVRTTICAWWFPNGFRIGAFFAKNFYISEGVHQHILAVVSGLSGLNRSMRQLGHGEHLHWVVGTMLHAQWVSNGHLRGYVCQKSNIWSTDIQPLKANFVILVSSTNRLKILVIMILEYNKNEINVIL